MPALPIAWFYARVRGVRLVVDWHNYGHTILSLSLRDDHPFVRFYKWNEAHFGARADASRRSESRPQALRGSDGP